MAKGIGEINSNVDMIFIKNMTRFLTSLYGLIVQNKSIILDPAYVIRINDTTLFCIIKR